MMIDRIRAEIKNDLYNGVYDYILGEHKDINGGLEFNNELIAELSKAIQEDNTDIDKESLSLALCDVLELIMV